MKPIVVIPTYNEASNITAVIDAVLASTPGAEILVVDDSSPDGTAERVRAHPQHPHRVHLLSRATKEGLGPAYRAGMSAALAGDFDVIVQMDADLSHPPDRLPALLEALRSADVAIGSRYVRGGALRDWPAHRRAISWAANVYVSLLLNLEVHDVTAGFKAFRREALLAVGAVHSESDGYAFQIENTWRASRIGLSTAEVPITFTDRTTGESKMSTAIVREAVVRVLAWRWDEIRQARRGAVSARIGRPHVGV